MDTRPDSLRRTLPLPPDDLPTLALDKADDLEVEREWSSGTVLNGQYEILEQVSRGAWGTVWRAWQTRIERPVAIKRLIARDERGQMAARARFEREAKLASKIRDPNAVRIIDYGLDGPTPYLVMEWIDGVTLADAIAAWNPLPPELIETIGLRVASALASAHACGIVHRDLKPSNIMMVEASNGLQPIVIDFGLARTFSPDEPTVTRADVVIGTPAYMSPEAIVGQEITPASDLYSLGVILAEATLGSNPFRGKTSAESMTLHLQPLSFTKETLVIHGASERFSDIIMHLLKSSPAERLSSAEETVRAIEAIRTGPRAPWPPQPAPRASRPEPFETTSTRAVVSHDTKLPFTRLRSLRLFSIAILALISTALLVSLSAGLWESSSAEQTPSSAPSTLSIGEGAGSHSSFQRVSRIQVQRSDPPQGPGYANVDENVSISSADGVVPWVEPAPTAPERSPTSDGSHHGQQAFDDNGTSAFKGHDDPRVVTPLDVSASTSLALDTAPRREPSRLQRGRSSKAPESAPSTLVITSLPAAEIIVDGKSHGVRTNIVLRDLRQREVHVAAIFEGKRDSRTLPLAPGERSVTGFRFERRGLESQAARP